MDKYAELCDRELMVKLIGLIEDHNKMTDEKEKRKAATRKKKMTKAEMSAPIEDPIKSDITKMLEKPKKRRITKQDIEEQEMTEDSVNSQPSTTFLEQDNIQPEITQTITEKPVKEKPTPAKLFKEDLLMKIDPNERVKAIEAAKNTLLSQVSPSIKEDETKRNITNFLSTYSKNKKY